MIRWHFSFQHQYSSECLVQVQHHLTSIIEEKDTNTETQSSKKLVNEQNKNYLSHTHTHTLHFSSSLSSSLIDFSLSRKRERDCKVTMASTMRFPANSTATTTTTTESFPRRYSISGFIGVASSSPSYRSKSLLIRRAAKSRSLNPSLSFGRSAFSVRCLFGSEAKKTLQDHAPQQQQGLDSLSFSLSLYIYVCIWFFFSILFYCDGIS